MASVNRVDMVSNIRDSVVKCIKSVDIDAKNFDIEKAKGCYQELVNYKINHPTTTSIIIREQLKDVYAKYPEYSVNIKEVESQPKIRSLIDYSLKNFYKLYPKTGNARNALIRADRFDIGTIKPALRGFQKALMRLRVMF